MKESLKRIKVSLILYYSVIFLFMTYGSQFISNFYNIESEFLLAITNGVLAGITIYLIQKVKFFRTKEIPILLGLLIFIGLPIISLLIDLYIV